MRELQPLEQSRLAALTRSGFRFGLFQPTGNALTKCIMDATEPLRDFLKRRRVHDFDLQPQGEEHKVRIPAHVLVEGKWQRTDATLYRPMTKDGDPRIWFSRLGRVAGANNVIAIIEREQQLFLVNLTRTDVLGALQVGPLAELVDDGLSGVARELLGKLAALAGRGSLRAKGFGDTTVGMTLEAALGVPANSSRAPDYKGIELKATRGAHKTRSNLFAQVPDWKLSGCRSSEEILELFGYFRGPEERLYCTVSSRGFNSQGLKLEVMEKQEWLQETSTIRSNVAVWPIAQLRASLLKKHNETFWVRFHSEYQEGVEYFTLIGADYTRDPNDAQLGPLLASGIITVDHLIKRKASGGVLEKGPLFKMKKKDFGTLFPPPKKFTF